ncbi:hypothetical protein JTE90_022801 [Oedothorax gibbosus]|uniref:Uncharacterized protein n=1 Tax=Oedothorax gibbosus TaxID=931172 RepID=A0AAV6V7W6_9ARAC|nr:hypothetical protein JTE90_022801 [Oedothorax gibbosus]
MDESGSSEKGLFPRKSSEEKSTTESEEHLEKKPKMSILRKLCFLLSLNAGIVYAAAFLWFIPCRQPFCLMKQKDWAVNVSGKLTSNMEASPSSSELASVIFGYSDNIGGHLAAFSVADGKRKWNKRNDHVIKHVFCNLNHPEGSPEGISKCYLTGYNYIAAFDESNGHLSWEQNSTRLNGEVMHKIALSGNSKSGYHILGVSDKYLFVVNAKNGSLVSTADLPCHWTIDIKFLGPLKNHNWVLVCEFGDSVEVWTFNEKDLLNSSIQSDVDAKSKPAEDQKFQLLFKRSSAKNSESIDLGGDVTRIGDSLVLSWADMVSMVTAQAPSQPTRLWEVRKWGAAHPHSVTSIISGSFTKVNKIQIAVAVKDGYNTTIHILDATNGTSVLETNLGSRSVMSMEKINGENGEPDVIVIESVSKMKSNVDLSTSEVMLPTSRAYFTIQYSGKNVTYQNIASTEVSESLLIPHSHGYASLILASTDLNGKNLLKRFVITSKQQEAVCHWGVHTNSTTVLLLD